MSRAALALGLVACVRPAPGPPVVPADRAAAVDEAPRAYVLSASAEWSWRHDGGLWFGEAGLGLLRLEPDDGSVRLVVPHRSALVDLEERGATMLATFAPSKEHGDRAVFDVPSRRVAWLPQVGLAAGALSADGKRVAVMPADESVVRVFDTRGLAPVAELSTVPAAGPNERASDVLRLSADGSMVFVGRAEREHGGQSGSLVAVTGPRTLLHFVRSGTHPVLARFVDVHKRETLVAEGNERLFVVPVGSNVRKTTRVACGDRSAARGTIFSSQLDGAFYTLPCPRGIVRVDVAAPEVALVEPGTQNPELDAAGRLWLDRGDTERLIVSSGLAARVAGPSDSFEHDRAGTASVRQRADRCLVVDGDKQRGVACDSLLSRDGEYVAHGGHGAGLRVVTVKTGETAFLLGDPSRERDGTFAYGITRDDAGFTVTPSRHHFDEPPERAATYRVPMPATAAWVPAAGGAEQLQVIRDEASGFVLFALMFGWDFAIAEDRSEHRVQIFGNREHAASWIRCVPRPSEANSDVLPFRTCALASEAKLF